MPKKVSFAYRLVGFALMITVSFGVFVFSSLADDIEIYSNNGPSSNASYVMLSLDYRQDLSGPFCKDKGNAQNQCIIALNTPATFTFLQALDAAINGVPSGAGDGDADGDGLRDSIVSMRAFSASKLQALIAVARAVFQNVSGVNVGLMISNKDNGGTILRGYKEFQPNDANRAKQELIDILLALPVPAPSNSHESQPKELHYEWFRYINGGPIIFGNQTASNFNATNNPAPDATIFNGSNYRSPFTSRPENFECTQFSEIAITSGNETGTDAALTNEITLDMNAAAAAKYEDMVGYMANNDMLQQTNGIQKLKTWFIHVGGNGGGSTAGNSAENIKAGRWATAAGTGAEFISLSDRAEDLVNIQRILKSVLVQTTHTSATFVSSAIPTNVFNRAKSLDDFFVAIFEPGSTERWAGNIKKFKLVDTNNDNKFNDIIDVNHQSAFDTHDGKIKNTALSLWTRASDLPPANLDEGEVAGVDGRAVTRGGAGQVIPGFIGDDVGLTNAQNLRQMYVEPSSGKLFNNFDANTLTATTLQAILGAATIPKAVELIAWARGVDVDNEDNDLSIADARPWLMGAPLHSRPLPINYGTVGGYSETNPNVRLFFGTNDGFFHILENTTATGQESGREIFAFIPQELLPHLTALRTNKGSTPLPYGMDGEPVALVVDQNGDGNIAGSDEVYVYSGMRRGGKSYYALDASNPSATPQLKWKITKTTHGDFNELGYTFSTPVVAKVRFEQSARDVLIFAGGFDFNKNDSAGDIARGPDSEGNAIYIVDARTGELIWKVTGATESLNRQTNTTLYERALTHSIPSAVTALDSNSNGVVDRLYVGDTGSVVWRVDIPEGTAQNHRQDHWRITKLGDFWDISGSQDRRFFYPPDIVQTKDAQGNYDGVIIQSGDRSNPTETRDANYIFYIKDRSIRSGVPPQPLPPKVAGDGIFNMDDLADATSCVAAACTMLNYTNGWKIKLNGRGEKGLSSPVITNGKVFFTTYIPAVKTNSCSSPEGGGQLYIVDLKDGAASFNSTRTFILGAGIPPAVTVVGFDTVIIPSTGIVNPFALVASPSPTKPIQVGGSNIFIIYWNELGIDVL